MTKSQTAWLKKMNCFDEYNYNMLQYIYMNILQKKKLSNAVLLNSVFTILLEWMNIKIHDQMILLCANMFLKSSISNLYNRCCFLLCLFPIYSSAWFYNVCCMVFFSFFFFFSIIMLWRILFFLFPFLSSCYIFLLRVFVLYFV